MRHARVPSHIQRFLYGTALLVPLLIGTAGVASAGEILAIEIPAKPLSHALRQLAQKTSTNVLFAAEDVAGLKSTPISGRMSAEEAARRLLMKTSLAVVPDSSGSLIIRKAPRVVKAAYQPMAAQNITSPAPAAQSSSAEASASVLEDIVVTAQRRQEKLQDVPVTVTALTSQSLTNNGVNSTTNLQQGVPGLVSNRSATFFLPYIRGVGSNAGGSGNESSVAVYVDGVYLGSKSATLLDLLNVERIEVLKGPQGTLFGRNATGGAINIITSDPAGASEIRGELGYGRFNEKQARFYAAGDFTETLAASIAYSGRWDDGYIRNIQTGKNQNHLESQQVYGKLHWKPTDRLDATLVASYSYTDDGTFASEHVEPGTISAAEAAGGLVTHNGREAALSIDRSLLTTTVKRVGSDIKYDLGIAELVSITGYVKTKGRAFLDVDTSAANMLHAPNGTFSKQFSQELQLRSATDGALSWIAGGYYFWFKDGYPGRPNDTTTQIGLSRFVTPADLLRPGVTFTGVTTAVTTKSASLFAQLTYKVFENTRLTAGFRYTNETKGVFGYSYRYTAVPGNPVDSVPVNNGYLTGDGLIFATVPLLSMDLSKKWNKATWRIALDHKFTDDIMAYASMSRGFKAGAYAPANINPAQVAVNPEILDAYEIGLKSELFDRRLRLNISGFYYNYKDIQLQLVNSTGRAFLQNAASARVYGLDLDATAVVATGLTLRGGLNLLNSKYKKFPNAQTYLPKVVGIACPVAPRSIDMTEARRIASLPQTGGNCNYNLDVTGRDLVFAPKVTANIGADYEIQLSNAGSLRLSSSLYLNSGYDFAPGGLFAHVGSFEELTASATWITADDRYYVRIWGQNLTDNRRPLTIQPTAAVFREISARPTSYGVTLGFKFGG